MPCYEYKTIKSDSYLDEVELDPLGASGWELVAVMYRAIERDGAWYYFRRAKPAEDTVVDMYGNAVPETEVPQPDYQPDNTLLGPCRDCGKNDRLKWYKNRYLCGTCLEFRGY